MIFIPLLLTAHIIHASESYEPLIGTVETEYNVKALPSTLGGHGIIATSKFRLKYAEEDTLFTRLRQMRGLEAKEEGGKEEEEVLVILSDRYHLSKEGLSQKHISVKIKGQLGGLYLVNTDELFMGNGLAKEQMIPSSQPLFAIQFMMDSVQPFDKIRKVMREAAWECKDELTRYCVQNSIRRYSLPLLDAKILLLPANWEYGKKLGKANFIEQWSKFINEDSMIETNSKIPVTISSNAMKRQRDNVTDQCSFQFTVKEEDSDYRRLKMTIKGDMSGFFVVNDSKSFLGGKIFMTKLGEDIEEEILDVPMKQPFALIQFILNAKRPPHRLYHAFSHASDMCYHNLTEECLRMKLEEGILPKHLTRLTFGAFKLYTFNSKKVQANDQGQDFVKVWEDSEDSEGEEDDDDDDMYDQPGETNGPENTIPRFPVVEVPGRTAEHPAVNQQESKVDNSSVSTGYVVSDGNFSAATSSHGIVRIPVDQPDRPPSNQHPTQYQSTPPYQQVQPQSVSQQTRNNYYQPNSQVNTSYPMYPQSGQLHPRSTTVYQNQNLGHQCDCQQCQQRRYWQSQQANHCNCRECQQRRSQQHRVQSQCHCPQCVQQRQPQTPHQHMQKSSNQYMQQSAYRGGTHIGTFTFH